MTMYSNACGQTPAQCDFAVVVIPHWLLFETKPRRAKGKSCLRGVI